MESTIAMFQLAKPNETIPAIRDRTHVPLQFTQQ